MTEPEDFSIINEIDRLTSRQPFVPFAIVMASGREYDVTSDVSVATGTSTISLFRLKGASFVLHRAQISEIVMDREPL